jgi:tetratricopeptide (TPR) repeat protein
MKVVGDKIMDRTKVFEMIENYQQMFSPNNDPHSLHEQASFFIGICYIYLEEYNEAQRQFERAINTMFGSRKFWEETAQPDMLVEACVLSGRSDLYPAVGKELELYKQIPSKGDSPIAYYAYGFFEYLFPIGWDINKLIEGLLKKPKWKLTYAIGQVFQSLEENDSLGLENSIVNLLAVHKGRAKYGELRETAEGLICLPAMSLAYVARKRNMIIEIENEYLPLSYLDYVTEVE